jgi:hypothetical protein
VSASRLDGDRISAIAHPMMVAIRDNFLRGPDSRDRCYEALNALAFNAATVIAGTGDRAARREARAWFDRALEQNITDLVRKPPGA